MTYRGLAVHRTIVAFDVEGFGARRRTNPNQVAVRDGLYRAVREAFRNAGIPWADGDHEDRGDGMFILIGSEVPKSLFVESLPSALVGALRQHNSGHPEAERIRLRMALHAGEVNYDGHGATAAAINLTFRLLESDAIKQALARSADVLAVITSSWFFEEVVRHSTADAAAYRPVPVAVKETVTTGWVWLADHRNWSGPKTPGYIPPTVTANQMAAGSAARPDGGLAPFYQAGLDALGLPVAVPLSRLPPEIRGRDLLLAELRRSLMRRPSGLRLLARRTRRQGRTWVLAGMGGLGKSTLALAVAQAARARGWRVWWVTATDMASLTGGMLEVLRQLQAPETVTRPVREGAPAAAERAWEFLNGPHLARRRWLLIFDNTDVPAVLAAPGRPSPADHAGWLRPDPAGMVIVTTRNRDPRAWGRGIALRELTPLDTTAAALILTDLAPGVHDQDGREARELGHRLGGLPLALHLAGSYLASPLARWHTFADYRRALDSVELPTALADLDDSAADARGTIQQTWDLSLDALAADGHPQARPLLLLLSCYAPATPIPASLLQPQPLADLLTVTGHQGAGREGDDAGLHRRLRSSLHDLAAVGLIGIAGVSDSHDGTEAVTVHPVVADANRARLRTTALPDLPAISEAAVRLLQAAASRLDSRRPSDWPTWRYLAPHIQALLGWIALQLEQAALVSLLDISNSAADALLRGGNPTAAEKLARIGVTAGTRLDLDHRTNLTARFALAAAIEGRGRNMEAERLYREVLADQRRVLGDDHPDTLTTRYELARVVGRGHFEQAERLYREVLADQQRVLGSSHPRTLTSRHALARAIGQRGRYPEAENLYRELLPDQELVLGADHPDTLITRQALAWAIAWQGRHGEAERLYRRILADQRRVLGDDHPHVLGTRHYLAWSIAHQSRYREAEQQYQQVLADQQRILGDDHPITLYTRLNLAAAIAEQRRHREAEQMYRRLIADQQRTMRGDHPDTLEAIHNLAQVIHLQGRHDEAEHLYRQVLADRQRVLGDHHPSTIATRRMLARVISRQGRYGEAEQLFRQVLANQEQLLGIDHSDTKATRHDLERIAGVHALDQHGPHRGRESRHAWQTEDKTRMGRPGKQNG